MKLLFITDLNGNPGTYGFLISQAENFDAMLWAGSLTNREQGNDAEQQLFVERAYGAIQAKGCRVLACGNENETSASPWRWLCRQGTFITPGVFVTTMPYEGLKRARLMAMREAAWNAGALWILLSRGPITPGLLSAGAPKSMLLRPNSALRFGPDVIMTTRNPAAEHESSWCVSRGYTWIFTPGGTGGGEFPAYVVLDLRNWTATRCSTHGAEQRDVSVLSRIPLPENTRHLTVA